jgi:hypothetical protein
MAFDFLGTFNRSQFDRLVAFARDQIVHVDPRIKHIVSEQTRVGYLRFTYDSAGRPIKYSTGSEGGSPTYIGKLMGAYEALGGDPFHELQTRMVSQAVFLPKGTEVSAPKVMSNGEPIPGIGLADAPTAKFVSRIKSGVSGMIERRAALGRKIRRMVDYGDQLQAEMDSLMALNASAESDGSLENIVTDVKLLLTDRNYRAVSDDKGNDEFGKLTQAPMAGLNPGPDRANPDGLVVERGGDGVVISGEGGSTA